MTPADALRADQAAIAQLHQDAGEAESLRREVAALREQLALAAGELLAARLGQPLPPPLPGTGDVFACVVSDWKAGDYADRGTDLGIDYAETFGVLRSLCTHHGRKVEDVLWQRRAVWIQSHRGPLTYGDGRGIQEVIGLAADLCACIRREMGTGPWGGK